MKCPEITLTKDIQIVVYHRMDCYSIIKSNRLFIHTTQVNIKIIMIIERKYKKNILHTPGSYLYKILKKCKYFTVTKDRSMFALGVWFGREGVYKGKQQNFGGCISSLS